MRRLIVGGVALGILMVAAMGAYNYSNAKWSNPTAVMLFNSADSSGTLLESGGTDGSMSVDDVDRDRDHTAWTPDIINGTFYEGSVVSADSSIVYDVSGYRSIWLGVKCYPDSSAAPNFALNGAQTIVALTVRFHAGGATDSLSTYVIPGAANTATLLAGASAATTWGDEAAANSTTTEAYETAVTFTQQNGRPGYGFIVPVLQTGLAGTGNFGPGSYISVKARITTAPGTSWPFRVRIGMWRQS